jgi:hypothetical protein
VSTDPEKPGEEAWEGFPTIMLKIKFTPLDLKKRLRLLRDLAARPGRRRRGSAAAASENTAPSTGEAQLEGEAAFKPPWGS